MTVPVKGLHPRKKVSWTIWNLNQNGQVESWLASRSNISANELLEDVDGEWIIVPGDSPALDGMWKNFYLHGIAQSLAGTAPSMLYVPEVRGAHVKR